MAVHACFKNEFTEDEKYHNLMSRPKYQTTETLPHTHNSKFLPWVHHQSSEEVGPGDVVHGILFWCYCPCYYLSIEMVG